MEFQDFQVGTISGIFGILWLALWLWYASDTPATHRRISPAEREFIVSSLSHDMSGHGDEKDVSIRYQIRILRRVSAVPQMACWSKPHVLSRISDFGSLELFRKDRFHGFKSRNPYQYGPVSLAISLVIGARI